LEIVNPQILKNGVLCAAPKCNILRYNTTSKMIKFNVSSWSNYTISEVTFAGGSGTAGDPYQINSWYGLDKMRTNLSAYYILTANLSSSTQYYSGLGNSWVPIGNSTAGYRFNGTFNGSGNTISDLTINLPSSSYVGLFGGMFGNISNVGLINVNVTGSNAVGGLVGDFYGTISNSYSTGNVAGTTYVGGLVGTCFGSGSISNSYSTGNVSGSTFVGGLVGVSAGSISSSYSAGRVIGSSNVGGFVGSVTGTIANSYSTGRVIGSSNVGGLAGSSSGTITNSYWDIQTSEQQYSAGDAVGKSTIDMKKIGTFSSWNISTNLTNNGNSYPYLAWQAGNNSAVWMINYDPSKLYECGVLNLSNTVYALQNNITFYPQERNNCLDVVANNITIDAGGYSILESGAMIGEKYSINVSGFNNITIKNLATCDGSYGILFKTSNSTIRNISNCKIEFSQDYYGNNNVIENSIGLKNIQNMLGNNNVLRNNVISVDSGYAVQIYGASNNNSLENNSIGGGTYGLYSGPTFNYNLSLINNNISGSIASIYEIGGSSINIVYSNSFGEIRWNSTSLPVSGPMVLGNTINISNGNVVLGSGLTGLNKSANITLYTSDYSGQYPSRLRKIFNANNVCTLCNNLTGMDASTFVFNVSNFGSGNISVRKSVNSSDDVVLDSGWNMIALTLQGNASGDRNVSLESGWNLIGYSSESEFNVSLMRFTNASGYSASWADAARAGKVQKYISYYDANESKNKYLTVGTGKTEMDQSGYWIYATEAGTLTLPSVGGSAVGETYALSDITFTNGTVEKNISEAVSAGWVDGGDVSNAIYYAQPTGAGAIEWKNVYTGSVDDCEFLISQGETCDFSSWNGYYVKAADNVTMLRQD
jgi:hypothetical protein